jgi:aminoglycoside phosphotransferase family enzyme/predicted kinase
MAALASCEERSVASTFVDPLKQPAAYPHPVGEIRLLETHISYVFLTGEFAYKIKKAINPGFLDFTQLEQRRYFCQEEVRLNRRLAPCLYLAVVPICETPDGIRIGGAGPVIEYAVKMRQFPQSSLFDRCLSENRLTPAQVDALADQVAAFHEQLGCATTTDEYGTPEIIRENSGSNLKRLGALIKTQNHADSDSTSLDHLASWSLREYHHIKAFLAERKTDGHVRECHGDLHLGNIIWWHDAPQIFDGIEFNPQLRWIDVINEIAFTSMDFKAHGRSDLAYRFLNRYLENTGDYPGLKLLAYYETNRALVRAMVARLRNDQESGTNCANHTATCSRYMRIARQGMTPRRRILFLMNGFSGSGKTTVSQTILEQIGAIRIRSDCERKRLHGQAPGTHKQVSVERGIYDIASTRATYSHLVQLARQILDADLPVIVDAANLQMWQREIFRSQARAQGVPFLILNCQADEQTLFERVQERARKGKDASDADPLVLRHQLATYEPLSVAEEEKSILISAGEGRLEKVLSRLKAEVEW